MFQGITVIGSFHSGLERRTTQRWRTLVDFFRPGLQVRHAQSSSGSQVLWFRRSFQKMYSLGNRIACRIANFQSPEDTDSLSGKRNPVESRYDVSTHGKLSHLPSFRQGCPSHTIASDVQVQNRWMKSYFRGLFLCSFENAFVSEEAQFLYGTWNPLTYTVGLNIYRCISRETASTALKNCTKAFL